MNRCLITSLCVLWALMLPGRGDFASDYAALTSGIAAWPAGMNSSAILLYGTDNLPVAKETGSGGSAVAAAGYLTANGVAGPRAFVIGHDGILNAGASSNAAWQQLLKNVVLWAGNKAQGSLVVRYDSTLATGGAWLASQGFNSAQLNLASLTPGACDVYLYNPWSLSSAANVTILQNFVTGGGGLAMETTAWAASSANIANINKVLDRFGLRYTQDYADFPTVLDATPTALDNGPGALAVIADYFDGGTLPSAADQTTSRNTLNPINGIGPSADYPVVSAFNLQQEAVAAGQPVVTISPSAPFDRTTMAPAMDWLVSMQCALLRKWAPADLPACGGAAGWPGVVAAAAPRVTRTVTIDGNASAASGIGANHYGMTQETRYVMRPTGLYCPQSNAASATYAGAGSNANGNTVTLVFPASVITSGTTPGLRVQVNHDIEGMLGIPTQYNRWPVLDRYYEVNTAAVVGGGTATLTVGSGHGGLIQVCIPPGQNFGAFQVTVQNGVECPHYDLGVTDEAEWTRLRSAGAPFGYVRIPDFGPESPDYNWLLFVRSKFLAGKDFAFLRSAAKYWRRVMNTGTSLMGIKARGRGESAVCGLDIIAGYGHAGYPIVMDYWDSDTLAAQSMMNGGDWGFYHEFGHTFQDTRGSDFDIATSGEVFVNFLPYLLLNQVHGIRSWDSSDIHGDYDYTGRLGRLTNWLTESAANPALTWGGGTYGFDAEYEFIQQFTDAFGWETFRKGMETEWDKAVSGCTADRMFLMLCNASGRNLAGFFSRFKITVSVSALSQVAALPAWSQNQAPALLFPGGNTVTLDLASAAEDSVVCSLGVSDADPANLHRFTIAGGNTDNAFALDLMTGKLILRRPGALTQDSYTLGITVSDEAVPVLSDTQTLTVNVTYPGGLRGVQDKAFAALGTQSAGAVLGSMGGVGATGWTVLSGNADNAIAVNAAGTVTLQTPSALPAQQPRYFTLRATGTDGVTRDVRLTLFCNFSTVAGAGESRWTVASSVDLDSFDYTTAPNYSGTVSSLALTTSTADNYIRRLSGFLLVPATGEYTFWIASDDDGQFFLSPDTHAASMARVCSLGGWTGVRTWTASSSQKSSPVFLRAGQVCYFEVRHREGGGSDHVEVAWTGPGIATQTDIGGANIARSVKFDSSGTLLSASPMMTPGTLLATLTTGGTVTGWTLPEGDAGGVFSVDAGGGFHLAQPSLLDAAFHIYQPVVAARKADGTTTFFDLRVCSPCQPGVLEELWNGRGGSLVSDFAFAPPANTPDAAQVLTVAQRATTGVNYARRLSGLFIAQSTGRHRFWLTANHPGGAYADSAELWISPTDEAAHAVRQAWVESPKQAGDFDKSPRQWTDPVELTAGKAYYYEIRQKNGASTGDHLSLAWTGPAASNSLGSTAAGASRTLVDSTCSMVVETVPVVNVVAAVPSAVEGGVNASFTITRSGPPAAALVVNLQIEGTAVPGEDYTSLPSSITLPAGVSSTNLAVHAIADLLPESAESVVVTIAAGTGYEPGGSSSATVSIFDAFQNVSVRASGVASETGPTAARFVLSRDGTEGSLTVNFTLSGTAAAGTDYASPGGSVVFADGSSTAVVTITPVNDTATEGAESVILTLAAGTGYLQVVPDGATLSLLDNEGAQNLPAPPWTFAGDVGTVLAGNTSSVTFGGGNGGTDLFSVRGSGALASGNTADGLRFVAQPVTGDCEIIARVASVSSTSTSARSGVMIRAGTAPGDAFGGTLLRGGTRTPHFLYRTASGVSSSNTAGGSSVSAPCWVRLVRAGTTLTSYVSANGSTWTQIGTTSSVTLPATVQVGLVAALSTSAASTVTFDNVKIRQNLVRVDAPPANAAEGSTPVPASFTISRGNLYPAGAIAVPLTLGGTAVHGADYSLSGGGVSVSGSTATVTIPSGAASIQLTVTPLTDLLVEGLETVMLTAQASSSYALDSISSGLAGILNAPIARLTVEGVPADGGGVDGSGIFLLGGSRPITATPAAGWRFTGWSGAGVASPSSASTTVAMDADKTVTASFERIQHLLTVLGTPAEGGAVAGGGTYNEGSSPVITATPADGWQFEGWTGDGIASPFSASTTVGMNTGKTVTAAFSRVDEYPPWIARYGFTGADAEREADPDGDGMPNVLEKAFGFAPDDPGSSLKLSVLQTAGNLADLQINKVIAEGEFHLLVDRDLDGVYEDDIPLVVPVTRTGFQFSHLSVVSPVYYRILYRRPPSP
ncbi:MAG: M60 family metallopeptidase [Kiritimatiellia bacterium]